MKDNPLEEIESELTFWEDYISAWEIKNRKFAEARMLEVLEAVRRKYQQALVIH
jgi:hypothetical protein